MRLLSVRAISLGILSLLLKVGVAHATSCNAVFTEGNSHKEVDLLNIKGGDTFEYTDARYHISVFANAQWVNAVISDSSRSLEITTHGAFNLLGIFELSTGGTNGGSIPMIDLECRK